MIFSDNEVNSMFSFVCCSRFVRSLAGLLSFVKNKPKTVIYWSSIPQIYTLLLLYAMVIKNFGELKTKVQQQPDDLQMPGQKYMGEF